MELYSGHDTEADVTYLLTVHADGSRVLSVCAAAAEHNWTGPTNLTAEPVTS